MKLCSIHIFGFNQFNDTYLDFTHPKTGEPLDKICFIGRNGTGKTQLLKLINNIIQNPFFYPHELNGKLLEDKTETTILIKYLGNNDYFYSLYFSKMDKRPQWLSRTIDENQLVAEISSIYRKNDIGIQFNENNFERWFSGSSISNGLNNENFIELYLEHNKTDLLTYSPSETATNDYLAIADVPNASVSKALELDKNFPFYHIVSDGTSADFWNLLIYQLKKRDNDRNEYENQKENLSKTKQQLIDEFEAKNPRILDEIASLWNKILEPAGLVFDIEKASNPIQLNDNLLAYITIKATGQKIPYNQLSSGIRNFMFRIGHIYSLYFNREVKRGFLLVDEPENGLFPDFLFDLMETYDELLKDKNGENNTQVFFATHNPIVAGQFEPFERIILEWNNEGHVSAQKGVAPVGDDPNDVLISDFGLTNLMGPAGRKKWDEYLDKKKKLRHSKDHAEKLKLEKEIGDIGRTYNF